MTKWRLNSPLVGRYKDELVRSVDLGKLFHFWEERNAWWGRRSLRYCNDGSFHPELTEIQLSIDQQRIPGSRWHIIELPALLFLGELRALVAVEIDTIKPFSNLLPRPLARHNLTNFKDLLLGSPDPDSIWTFFSKAARVKPCSGTPIFLRYTSISYGGTEALRWSISREKYKLDGVRAVLDTAQNLLHQKAGSETDVPSRDLAL